MPYIDSANSISRLALLASLLTHLKLFFISRSFAITSTGSVLRVAFWISGSWLLSIGLSDFYTHDTYFNSHENVMLLRILVRKPFQVRLIELLAFSSPIVNFPCVSLFLSANACNFFTASLCKTEMPNLTFAFVYSCPG